MKKRTMKKLKLILTIGYSTCTVEAFTAATEATGVERPTFAIDGKTFRRSHYRRRNLGTLHSVSVWASKFGLTLAQVATAEKSNEITAIRTLLSLVDIHGAIITIDAMGTQTAIAEKIIKEKGDYVLALKRIYVEGKCSFGNEVIAATDGVKFTAQHLDQNLRSPRFVDVRKRTGVFTATIPSPCFTTVLLCDELAGECSPTFSR
jgi:hypothetical protein